MFLILIFLVLLAVIGVVFYFRTAPKQLRYDANKVRELEMEIWGYYFTPAPEPKPRAMPSPPKGNGGGSSPLQSRNYCQRCDLRVTSGRDACQSCTRTILDERRREREKQAAFTPRSRILEHEGISYRALMPSGVPDNAHAEIMGDPLGSWAEFKRVAFTWTDQSTGKKMFMTVMANEVERHDILTGSGKVVKSFCTTNEVRAAPMITTAKGYK